MGEQHPHPPGQGICDGNAGNTFSILDAPDDRLNRILERVQHSEAVVEFTVFCPAIARFCKPGQFFVVRGEDTGERVPLTIADFDRAAGTITMVIQRVGVSTDKLCAYQAGDRFRDIVGPLGHASDIEHFGTVVCIGGGLGIAPVYPIQRALREAGNTVHSIIGARSSDLLFWQERMQDCADTLSVVTDDGSAGEQGFVTTALEKLIARGVVIDRVIAIGPPIMMRVVSDLTRQYGIKTIVSLNSIMVDGTGMCGGCRVQVGDQTRYTCADGPEFDAHRIDWDLFFSRMKTYQAEEAQARQAAEHPNKKRIKQRRKQRVPMPEQGAAFRAANFDEVALGYTAAMAEAEAQRCLDCKKPHCVEGCPVGIDIPGFIRHLQTGDYQAAVDHIKDANKLPAICGRVCPQESQCEARCVVGIKNEPVAIGRLERFAADWEADRGELVVPELPEWSQRRVAVIGAGPAGLSAAAELALFGHKVTVFEALHTAGGVLVYGIPEFRLPKAIVEREVRFLEHLGVDIRVNQPIGQAITVPYLMDNGFDAVFIGTGAGLPMFLDIPGENLKGVYSANEFLTRVNLMKAYRFPDYDTPVLTGRATAVIGGGNVAMDAARSALRLGAEQVSIVYRRTRAEMPARAEEIHHALEEGVELVELVSPLAILGDEDDRVVGMRVQAMELGEPDEGGRRRPQPIPGQERVLDVDQVVVAIGQGPNPMLSRNWPELELNRRGNIATDEQLMTNIPGVFAGGDIVTGAATVIEAMGAGKQAARHIDAWLAETSVAS